MEIATEKQVKFIYMILGKEYGIHYEDIAKLTKQEASGIIKRNIVEHRPLLQWYCTRLDNNSICAKKFEFSKYIKNMVSDRYYLNKRLLDEAMNTKLIEYSWEMEETK